jgi:hypothetical protein
MFDDAEGENVVPNLAINAEESEAAARKYCEGFTAHISVCESPMCPLSSRNAARRAVPRADLAFADESALIPLHVGSSVISQPAGGFGVLCVSIKLFDTWYRETVMNLAVQGVGVL